MAGAIVLTWKILLLDTPTILSDAPATGNQGSYCSILQLGIAEERVELLRSWRHSGFRVDTSRRVAKGDRCELESVLQYIDRPPAPEELRKPRWSVVSFTGAR